MSPRRVNLDRVLSIAALVVSGIAVALSQVHPLYTYLDKPKLGMSVTPTLQIYHVWGNLGLTPFIQVSNSGKAAGTMTRIEMLLERKGDSSFKYRLASQTYYLKPTSLAPGQIPTQVPFGPFTVAPDTSWESFVNFYRPFSKEQQDRIATLGSTMDAQLRDQFRPGDPTPKRIRPELHQDVVKFSETNLAGFGLGEYYLLVLAWADGQTKPIVAKCFSFSVFEADLRSMRGIIDRYQTGEGILFPPSMRPGFEAMLRAVSDDALVRRMTEEFERL